MIIDKFENIRFYEKMLPNLENGLKAVEALEKMENGRYEFDGGFFMVQEGDTVPMEGGNFEVHRKYIDVQIILEGCEELGWNHLNDLSTVVPYDARKDAEFLSGTFEHVMKITEGMFYAAFPADGHKPSSHTAEGHRYKKIVMKLPVEA